MSDASRKSIVLLSGGLDSTTTAAIAKSEGFDIFALSFRYGQRHEAEIQAARRVVEHLGLREHRVVDLDLRTIGGSALTSELAVPKGRSTADMSAGIPSTYVPARNTLFLSYALAWAEVLRIHDIFIGVNAVDYSGYPDCRPEFIEAFEQMANLATKLGTEEAVRVRIHAPLIEMTKGEIVRRGTALGVDYAMTSTCYDPTPSGEACGGCDACLLRLKGFEEAGMADPARYAR